MVSGAVSGSMGVLSDLKNGITNIDITQKSFEHINKNKSALVILKKGAKPQQFMLDNSNNNSAKLNFQQDKFVNLSPSTEVHSSTKNMLVYGLGALAIVGLLSFWFFKKRQA